MTKEIQSPNVEGRSGVEWQDSSFVIRIWELRLMENVRVRWKYFVEHAKHGISTLPRLFRSTKSFLRPLKKALGLRVHVFITQRGEFLQLRPLGCVQMRRD